jgi:hypothetical protein
MPPLQKLLFAAWLVALAASGSSLHAQAPDEAVAPPGEATPDVSVPMEKEAQISPAEMERSATEIGARAGADEKRVEELKAEARKQKDVIKLNCINDKLLQIKQLLNILEDGLSKLSLAIAGADEGERYHRYTVIKISGEKITTLRDEAEACVGEEISYLGPLSVNVDQPDVPDDPTADIPWDNEPIDPPGYASPFD